MDANRRTRQGQGAWRDEDETRYAEQRNDVQDQIAALQHERYTAMFGACRRCWPGRPARA